VTPAHKRRWLHWSLTSLFVVATTACGCIREQPAPNLKLISAIILHEVVSKDLDAKWDVIRVDDPTKLVKLESFFPNYRQRPTSDKAGAWMVGYEVYFNFPQGQCVHVSVSSDGNGADNWTVGSGDFEVHGDFKAFVNSLSSIE
jgi:hypothetical protein